MRALLSGSSLLLVVAAVACTTDPDEPIATGGSGAFFTRSGGSFDRLTITPTDGAGRVDAARFHAAVLNTDSTCTTGARRQSKTSLSIEAVGNGTAFVAGAYRADPTLTPGGFVITMQKTNDTCAVDGQAYLSETGTLNVTTVAATFIEGTFDVSMTGGGTLTGSFNIPLCPSLDFETCKP